mgnify:CR=1 FL=1|jgi:hypothetical protein
MIHEYIAPLLARILSIIQATNLRNELYTLKDEHEIMWTALSDIKRMSKEENIKEYVSKIQILINDKHVGKRKVYRIEG